MKLSSNARLALGLLAISVIMTLLFLWFLGQAAPTSAAGPALSITCVTIIPNSVDPAADAI